jgi:hypothetical protein
LDHSTPLPRDWVGTQDWPRSFPCAFKVIEATTTILSEAVPFGQVTEGWMVIEGLVSYIPPEFHHWDPENKCLTRSDGLKVDYPGMQQRLLDNPGFSRWDIYYDELGLPDFSNWVDAMLNGYYHLVIGGTRGLLLKKHSTGKYSRIGLAFNSFGPGDKEKFRDTLRRWTQDYEDQDKDFVELHNGKQSMETITIV